MKYTYVGPDGIPITEEYNNTSWMPEAIKEIEEYCASSNDPKIWDNSHIGCVREILEIINRHRERK